MIGSAKQLIHACLRTAWPGHGAALLRNVTLIHLERSWHSVNSVVERAEVDEDDDTEDNNWIVALVLNQYW